MIPARSATILAVALSLILTQRSSGEVALGGGTSAVFASVEEGKRILTTRDDFIQRLSPFDRAARMKTDKPVSEEDFLQFVGGNVLAWAEEEMAMVRRSLASLEPRLKLVPLPLPETVYLIKTTGEEEGGAPYTRGNAIVFPRARISARPGAMAKTICHELFHILSRHDPILRDALYGIIGFERCDELVIPPELQTRKITNPDAPRNEHAIKLVIDGAPAWSIPVLLSTAETYDPVRGGAFFQYLELRFLVVERTSPSRTIQPAYRNGDLRLPRLPQVEGFYEQVGRNTGYIIHPEEILADNFALLVLNEAGARSPDILTRMKEVLTGKTMNNRRPGK